MTNEPKPLSEEELESIKNLYGAYVRPPVYQLLATIDSLKLRAEKAEAACAQMRVLVVNMECLCWGKCPTQTLESYVCLRCKALSTDCDKDYVRRDRVRVIVEALKGMVDALRNGLIAYNTSPNHCEFSHKANDALTLAREMGVGE